MFGSKEEREERPRPGVAPRALGEGVVTGTPVKRRATVVGQEIKPVWIMGLSSEIFVFLEG